MRIRILNITVLFLCIINLSFGQYKTVVYDYEKNFFNEGQPLPAESYMMLSGRLLQDVEVVKIELLKDNNSDVFFTTKWKKSFRDQEVFNIPLNVKLREQSNYNLAVNYYRIISNEEKVELYNNLKTSLNGYVNQAFVMSRKSVITNHSSSKQREEMNEIVSQGTIFYENNLNQYFNGFSELVKDKLRQIGDLNLKKSKFSVFNKGEIEDSKFEKHQKFFDNHITELKQLLDVELIQYLNTIDYILNEKRVINNYPTEKGRTILPINVGYGAIYNSGGFSNLSYGQSPYVGLCFPLGNPNFNGKLLSNTSISFGAYLEGFEDQNGNKVSGPVIGVPLFLGVGVNVFKVFKVNVGATALQENPTIGNVQLNKVYLRPSVNVSFEFGLWLGLLKK